MAKRCSKKYGCKNPRANWWRKSLGVDWLHSAGLSSTQGVVFEEESEALFAAMTVPPSDAAKLNINTFIKYLKDNSLWSTFDFLSIPMQTHDNANGEVLIWWNDPSKTQVNVSATYVKNTGMRVVGASSQYFRTGYNPNGSSKFTLNSMTMGVFTLHLTNNQNVLMGAFNGSSRAEITATTLNGGTGKYQGYIFANDGVATLPTGVDANETEHFAIATRNDSTTKRLSKNSTNQDITATSAARPNLEWYAGARNLSGTPGGYATCIICCEFAASGWNQTRVDLFKEGFLDYMSGLTELAFSRFYALGDSLTLGSGATTPATEAFPYLIGVSEGVTQVNMGVGGESVQNAGPTHPGFVDRLTQFRYFNRNAIINILGGSNDIYYFLHPDGATLSLAGFRTAYDLMLDTLLSYGYPASNIRVCLLPWCTGERQAYLVSYNAEISASATARGIQVVDLYTPTVGQTSWLFDDVHYKTIGYQEFANIIAATL